MSVNAEENSNKNIEHKNSEQFQQLLLEIQSNELTMKVTQDNLNNCLKRNILMEHELETERLGNSLLKIKLDVLTSMVNNYDNSSKFDTKILIRERGYLTKELYKKQVENKKLKQELAKSNSQVSSLIENQNNYPAKIDLVTSLLNSLKVQVETLESEKNSLIKILCIGKILAKKILSAIKYSKQLSETQFRHIIHLVDEVSNIESKMLTFIHQNSQQNEYQQIIDNDKKNIIPFKQEHLKNSMLLVKCFEIEYIALLQNIQKMIEKQTVKDDADKV